MATTIPGDARAFKVQLLSLKKGTFQTAPPNGEIYVIEDIDGIAKLFLPNGTKTAIGGSGSQMATAALFQFAQGLPGLSSLSDGYEINFNKGSTGDYATDSVAGSGAAAIDTTTGNGGMLTLDTGATINSVIGIHGAASPEILLNLKTGGPFFAYGYSKLIPGTADAQTQVYGVGLSGSASPGTAQIVAGLRGAASTTNLTLATFNGSFVVATSSTPAPAGFAWYCIGFDGTTLSLYAATSVGALSTTPLVQLADLSQVAAVAGGPWIVAANGSTGTSRKVTLDKLGVFYAMS